MGEKGMLSDSSSASTQTPQSPTDGTVLPQAIRDHRDPARSIMLESVWREAHKKLQPHPTRHFKRETVPKIGTVSLLKVLGRGGGWGGDPLNFSRSENSNSNRRLRSLHLLRRFHPLQGLPRPASDQGPPRPCSLQNVRERAARSTPTTLTAPSEIPMLRIALRVRRALRACSG